MGRNPLETIMGAVVLLIAGLFLTFAYATADLRPVQGYTVSAVFNKVGGLQAGADVRISGIKVGTVTAQALDSTTYRAVVHMSVLPSVKLPSDTVASIASDGLLGGKYLKLDPGSSTDMLPDDGRISKVSDFQSVEDLVGELIFLATQDPKGGPSSASGSDAPQ